MISVLWVSFAILCLPVKLDSVYLPLPDFGGEDEPDASVPLQVSEDMVDDDISSRSISENMELVYQIRRKILRHQEN